ncbi:hypothetical protein HS088_TW07G00550 [Tripterygium wilfordii]|uniref:Uncharacterized protein n=1 Tax=Tripterygium wilfordii TaxID=458696 RepID=A0A7J7DFB7_TRIWF|nr:hypothetical protein HS088_TW07G00550 [Tripterygium wilfordii]
MSLISHSSPSSSRNYKICLVCDSDFGTSIYGYKDDYAYDVFVIDIGPCSGGRRRRRGPRFLCNPLFLIPNDYPACMSFFAFDPSIYFLGGFRVEEDEQLSRDVFVYDTSSGDSTLKKLSCMNYIKDDPVIIGPINEKFYVMSRCLSNHDFEQFDRKLDSWDRSCQPPCSFSVVPR